MRDEAQLRSLGRRLQWEIDTTEQALKTLKQLVGHDNAGRHAIRTLEALRLTVQTTAEELDPNIRTERTRRELSETPRRPKLRTP